MHRLLLFSSSSSSYSQGNCASVATMKGGAHAQDERAQATVKRRGAQIVIASMRMNETHNKCALETNSSPSVVFEMLGAMNSVCSSNSCCSWGSASLITRAPVPPSSCRCIGNSCQEESEQQQETGCTQKLQIWYRFIRSSLSGVQLFSVLLFDFSECYKTVQTWACQINTEREKMSLNKHLKHDLQMVAEDPCSSVSLSPTRLDLPPVL